MAHLLDTFGSLALKQSRARLQCVGDSNNDYVPMDCKPLHTFQAHADGIQALFLFVEIKEKANPKWKLHLKSDLQSLDNELGKIPFHSLLYFLRSQTTHDVDAATMEREIFCGEIKENPVQCLKSILNELCIPILRAQKDWGSCSQESVTHFLAGLDKYAAAIEDATNIANSEKRPTTILRRPLNILSSDFIQQRSAIVDSEVVEEYETLVSEWMKMIDQILMEAVDERVQDITSTPLTELERWNKRQKMLGFLIEQLRGKECKAVVGLLISAKSRLLKKWKAVDISITDAANVAKDRVKYLEALYRHLDSLATEHDPVTLTNSVLPAFFNGIRQMETMSRFFSRNGYLGLLLTKVSNQLVQNCQAFLRESLVFRDSEDRLWDMVREHMMTSESEPTSLTDVYAPQKNIKKEKHKVKTSKSNSTLHKKIRACVALHTYFQDALCHLREWLWGTHGMHQYSASSSISSIPGRLSSTHMVKTSKTGARKLQSVASSYDQQHDYQSTGVAITDDDTILYHLEVLCAKLKQIDDIMEKLLEFKILSEQAIGMRKPAREDLIQDDDSESGSVCDIIDEGDAKESAYLDAHSDPTQLQPQTGRQNSVSPLKLHTLVEEDEAQIFVGDSLESLELPGKSKNVMNSNDEPSNFESEEQVLDREEDNELLLSNEEKHMLANLYSADDMEDEETSLSSILMKKLEEMIDMLRQYLYTDTMLDTERRLDTLV
ncbi:Hypothetical predicted protein [Pelobates cultripes]|uniref:Dynein heavy chain tail domain-containing protein n=1 Tax=Pelobates cultripes TaxID=61616 RepID=A0AAD1VT94_PELCU|nr:Hypothetical predicted protein [Pelobates cultripes]